MIDVNGQVAPGFGAVADAFRRNFDAPGEHAAAVSVLYDGVKIVDLWAGTDRLSARPMPPDGLMVVASCTKGVTATVLALLVADGSINPDEKVATYWPEFAAAGKGEATVAMIAAHTVGLPYPPLGTGLRGLDLHRGPAVTAALAAARPLWRPGTAMAYHPVTYGTLLDEVVRRATGASIARHVQTRIAEPLGIDVWIGLPPAEVGRVVPGEWDEVSPMTPTTQEAAPGSYAQLREQFLRENPPMDPDFTNPAEVREHYAAERPGIGGITDARSLATMYGALLAPVDGVRLLDDQTLATSITPRTDNVETLIESGTAGPDIRFGLGYQLASPSMPGFSPDSFGHTGAGGRLGIADPSIGIGFGYMCSRMTNIGPHGDPRWATLIDAIKRCL